MRRFFLFLMVLVALKGFAHKKVYTFHPEGAFTFISYNYSSVYTLSSFSFEKGSIGGVAWGTVENLNEWTRSYAFKVNDKVQSTHRACLFSSGSLFDRLKTYEVYDENNQLIGSVEGSWDVAACFFFYKENRELFAKATLDPTFSHLTITAPDGHVLITGEKTLRAFWSHTYQPPTVYYWTLTEEEPCNPLFLWPFMGFLSEVWCAERDPFRF
jgi:hypothetical protein